MSRAGVTARPRRLLGAGNYIVTIVDRAELSLEMVLLPSVLRVFADSIAGVPGLIADRRAVEKSDQSA
jgi:hypothetical protein